MMPLPLKAWRQRVGVTQLELAARSGVSWATIKRLERDDDPDAARPSTRRKLARALGISDQEIIGMPPGFEAPK